MNNSSGNDRFGQPSGRNQGQVKRVFETADGIGLRNISQPSGDTTERALTSGTGNLDAAWVTATAGGGAFGAAARERSPSDGGSDYEQSTKNRKMNVFRQYTRTGESIAEMEQNTPEKLKIDELMGRTNSNNRNGHESTAPL